MQITHQDKIQHCQKCNSYCLQSTGKSNRCIWKCVLLSLSQQIQLKRKSTYSSQTPHNCSAIDSDDQIQIHIYHIKSSALKALSNEPSIENKKAIALIFRDLLEKLCQDRTLNYDINKNVYFFYNVSLSFITIGSVGIEKVEIKSNTTTIRQLKRKIIVQSFYKGIKVYYLAGLRSVPPKKHQ